MKNILSNLIKFLIAFCSGIFIITYLIRLPFILANNNEIVNEYYIENFIQNIPLDLFFIICYFLVAKLIISFLKITDFHIKLLIIAATTAILTGGFCYYFNSYKVSSNFFSRWFHTVGYSSVIYDVVLLSFIYWIYMYLESIIN